MRVPELLAPAGSLDALFAAVAAGADAVYVGLGAFNARAANAGLTLDELACACALAHAHGVRVYVTLNVYVFDAELDDAVALAQAAAQAGADAFIVADAGLCLRLRAQIPQVEVHLSTQAGVQCAEAVEFAARELDVARVTCARELSVDELRDLCATGVPIEAFCHGAICICYSGSCSYSALRRGRSANRGDCVQPCRMAYELQDAAGNVLAGGAQDRRTGRVPDCRADGAQACEAGKGSVHVDDDDAWATGDRLLCPRDYLGIRYVEALTRAGVASLKIEGRMKNPDYVFNVVRCYRAALDAVEQGRPLDDTALDDLEAQLTRSFNRGFTDGYLRGGHAATGADHMSLERAINQGLMVGRVVSRGHEEVVIEFERPVDAGDTLEICSTPGEDAPADVPKRWPMVPCPAQARAGERLLVHCKRKVEVGSVVHVVRSADVIAQAQAAVDAMRAEAQRLWTGDVQSSANARTKKTGESSAATDEMAVRAFEGAQERPSEDPRDKLLEDSGDKLLEKSRPNEPLPGVDFHVSHVFDLGEVCRASDMARVRAACKREQTVICRNLGQIDAAREAGVRWEAASPISVWNAETARWLSDLGAQKIWLPEELSASDVAALRAAAEPELAHIIDVPTPGSTPLMITEHCILTAEGPCDHACATCARRRASQEGDRFLVELDRKSGHARLQVRVDEFGRTRIFA
ncbi:U32 family peptidase [Collinsella provencensis]|uniref:U32 family peptidase n=1 Tax=Collinsella provencensis TaxID=1937461 RepID=UPI00131CFDCA|nr:U32 family peptidase [Collinsella provencensis]